MEMKYIVYITINLCNGKFYIGVHRTNPNVFDGYIGLGIYRQAQATGHYPFHRAVRKYGYENFKRTTIKIFPDTEEGKLEASNLEATLVNETLLKSKSVYNTALGGYGNFTPDRVRRVYMFSLEGEYLKTFNSVGDAAYYILENSNGYEYYSIIKSIRNNCLGTTNSAHNYYWSYNKEFGYVKSKNIRKVAQYTLSGKFLRTFDSISQACAELGLNSIQQAISKQYYCGNYQWRYYDGSDSDIAPLVTPKTWSKLFPILVWEKDSDPQTAVEYSCVSDFVNKHPETQVTQISRVLRGIIRSHKGFSFKFKDGDIVSLL